MKDQQKMRNNYRLQETQKTQQIKAIWDPRLDPGTEKEHQSKKTGEIQVRSIGQLRLLF